MIDLKQFIGEKYVYIKYDAQNYYHALIDALPVLLEIRNYSPDTIFVLTNKSLKTVTKIVFDLKIKNLNLESVDNIDFVDRLKWVNPLDRPDWLILNRRLSELRTLLTVQENLPKKIIIKRFCPGRTKQRNICKDIFDHIVSVGFVEVVCSNYSVLEQANLFYNAEVIVSPHGADLSNMIFCQTGCKIIELSNGYNPNLFTRYVNNAIKNKQINLQKRIIFHEKIMQNKVIFQNNNLTDRSHELNKKTIFEIGKGSYIEVDLPIISKDEIHEDFTYNLDSFKEIFKCALS